MDQEKQASAQNDSTVVSRTFKFPKMTGLDMALCTLDADPQLLAEAKERGFYCGRTPYNKLFSELFFSGGKVDFKKDVDEEFKKVAWPYLRGFMGSFEPSHEDKEAICALLLSELVEPKLQTKAAGVTQPVSHTPIERRYRLTPTGNPLTEEEIEQWREFLKQYGFSAPPGANVLCDMAKAALRDVGARSESTDVPQGWKLVPVEPTVEMMQAAVHALDGRDLSRLTKHQRATLKARTRYAAMLAIAPEVSHG